jgi:hypothetical protein
MSVSPPSAISARAGTGSARWRTCTSQRAGPAPDGGSTHDIAEAVIREH